MKVKDLITLLDAVNPDYNVQLDINYTIEDSFMIDYTTRTIYLETMEENHDTEHKSIQEII